MNPTLKSALLAAFTITSTQASALETTSLNFTLSACTQDNREFRLPAQSQLEITPDIEELGELLFEKTQIYATQLNQSFDAATSKISQKTTQTEIEEIFSTFYAEDFKTLSTQYLHGLKAALPQRYTITNPRIVTKAINASGACAENAPTPQPMS